MKIILAIDTRESDKAIIMLKIDGKTYSKTLKKKPKSQALLPLIDKILRGK